MGTGMGESAIKYRAGGLGRLEAAGVDKFKEWFGDS